MRTNCHKLALIVFFLQFTGYHFLSAQHFGGGIKGGLAVSSLYSPEPYMGTRLGYTGGLFIYYNFSDIVGLQLGANYLQQGGTLVNFGNEELQNIGHNLSGQSTLKSNILMHNIDIPLLLQLYAPSVYDFRLKLFLGPALGINMQTIDKYVYTTHAGGNFMTIEGKRDVSSDFEKFHYGAIGGIGFELDLRTFSLFIDAAYRYPINVIEKEVFSYIGGDGEGTDNLKTHTVIVTLGVGF